MADGNGVYDGGEPNAGVVYTAGITSGFSIDDPKDLTKNNSLPSFLL